MNKSKNEEQMKIWDQLAGLNPTGQMTFQNGVLKPLGNISKIVTSQQLQSQNLAKTATNTPVSQNITVEGFNNKYGFIPKYDNDLCIRRYVYSLFAIIFVLIFILNIKKI